MSRSRALGWTAVGALMFAGPLQADTVEVNFTLVVDEVVSREAECDTPRTFACGTAVGERYVGSFDVDTSVFGSDGVKTGVAISNFFLQIGGVVWDQNDPNSMFKGFRDGGGNFTRAPDLVIDAGELVNMIGGVFGPSDLPFVDFSLESANRFYALDLASTPLRGCLIIGVADAGACAVSAPTSGALGLVGGLALLLERVRRRAQNNLPSK